ncbi:DC-STAMP-like protein [Mactra antiquata]
MGTSDQTSKQRGFQKFKDSDKYVVMMSQTEILFKSGREENKRKKAVVGVIAGTLVGLLLYILFVYSFDYSHLVAGIIVVLLTILICIGLALWSSCRCIMALVIPNFFTSRGRAVMMSIILSLLLTGPIQNISDNARETGSSMACIAEVVTNQTKYLHQQLEEPIQKMIQYAEKKQKALDVAQQDITNVVDVIRTRWKTIETSLKEVSNQINKLHQECGSSVNDLYKSCKSEACKSISFLDVSSSTCSPVCSPFESLSSACDGLKFSDTFATASKRMGEEFDKVDNYFKADVVVKGDFSAIANSSENTADIKHAIENDIARTVLTFTQLTTIAKKIMSITLLLMFCQSYWYFRNYMAKDSYDNAYITKEFIELDKGKTNAGETPVLPLKKRELTKYIQSRSIKLTHDESAACQKGLVQVFVLAILCTVVIAGDYCLYFILDLINQYGSVMVNLNAVVDFKITIKGKGPISDFYRILLGDFDLSKQYSNDVNVGGCLPNPSSPSQSYSTTAFIVLHVVLLTVVILRGYGMRLRRKIAAYYYPEQERQRIEFLYKSIKHDRNAHKRFLRQAVKSQHKENVMKEKFRFSTWVKSLLPCCRRCVATSSLRHCSSCEETNKKLLSDCNGIVDGQMCGAVYCKECKSMLNNICPLCSNEDVELRI